MDNVKEFSIHTEYITLGQMLKLIGEVGSGGEVKDYLANASPIVNGEPDNRRGRKLRPGDVIEFKNSGTVKCVAQN